jgi:hypothetical protein
VTPEVGEIALYPATLGTDFGDFRLSVELAVREVARTCDNLPDPDTETAAFEKQYDKLVQGLAKQVVEACDTVFSDSKQARSMSVYLIDSPEVVRGEDLIHLRGSKIPPKKLNQKPKPKEAKDAVDVQAVLERLENDFGCFNPKESSVGLGRRLDELQLQEALDLVAKLPNLTDLNLEGGAVSDATVRTVSKLVTLKALSLHKATVTGASLRQLSELAHLEYLNLTRVIVDDDAMAELTAAKSLKRVMLNRTPIGDTGVRHLCTMPALEGLYLKRTKITDAVFQHLSKCPCLQELDLEDTDVSDEGIQQLAGLKSLRELCVDGTRVTKAGIAALRKHLPKLRLG